jgi:hypothetical protein
MDYPSILARPRPNRRQFCGSPAGHQTVQHEGPTFAAAAIRGIGSCSPLAPTSHNIYISTSWSDQTK